MSATNRPAVRSRRPGAALGLFLLASACSLPPAAPLASASADPELAELVLAALDSEALYTVSGSGIKPVSSGFWRHAFEVDDPSSAVDAIEHTRQRLARLGRLSPRDEFGEQQLWWGALPFAATYEGERTVHAYVVHRRSLARLLERRADVFAPLGLTPSSEPAEVLAVVERLPRLDRFRGYGLLFGYPDAAVEFFVRADAERGDGGDVAPRDFRHIPTFAGERGRFVYAVPPGAERTPGEDALRARCVDLLEQYRDVRTDWVTGRREAVDIKALLEAAAAGFRSSPRSNASGAARSTAAGATPAVAPGGPVRAVRHHRRDDASSTNTPRPWVAATRCFVGA